MCFTKTNISNKRKTLTVCELINEIDLCHESYLVGDSVSPEHNDAIDSMSGWDQVSFPLLLLVNDS